MADKKGFNPIPILLIGGGVVALAALLLRRSVGQTVPAPVPSRLGPVIYPDLATVERRLDEVTTLFRTGRIPASDALRQTLELVEAAIELRDRGIVTDSAALITINKIGILNQDITRYMEISGG